MRNLAHSAIGAATAHVMKTRSFTLCAAALLMFFVTLDLGAQRLSDRAPSLTGFIENAGQWPEHVLFMAREGNVEIWITSGGVIIDEYLVASGLRNGNVTHEVLLNARFDRRALQHVEHPDHPQVAFIKGNQRANPRVFTSLNFRGVVPGVDVAFAVDQRGNVVREIKAVDQSALQALRLRTVGAQGAAFAEVTPPTSFVYGSYIGGSQADVMAALDVLPSGDVIVTGNTSEISFPTATGGYSTKIKGGIDVFVMRCDPKLQRVKSYTFFGGSSDDRVRAMTIDDNNNVYICGETISNDVPTTNTATSRTYKTGIDAFVAKFDSTLTKLLTGFYHGGNRDDVARAIDVDDNGTIVIAGATTSTVNLPNTMPATAALTWTFYPQMGNPEPISVPITSGRNNGGTTDGFVATFTGSGVMQQSRYYGKEGVDFFTSVAFDKSSNVYLTGTTASTNFETVPVANNKWSGRLPYDRTYNGGPTDAFVVKFNQNLTYSQTDGETFSTFLGGNRDDEARSIEVDALGRIYITGVTTSTNLPAVGTFATLNAGKRDGFYAQFGSDGGDIAGCTYFGGAGDDDLLAARLVPNTSNMLVVGSTTSSDFPIEGQGARSERAGATDGFLSVINLGALAYSTLIVGNDNDTVVGAVADRLGNPYYLVNSTSKDLLVSDSSFQRTGEGHTGYVGKLAFGVIELSSPSGGETICVGSSRSISWSALGLPDTTKFRIEYGIAGSGSWKDVVKSVGGRSYSWKVPALANGAYVVRISTIYGHVSELLTPFMISNPPAIVRQPVNASACLGKPVSISVAASGGGLKYQWRKQSVNITGATDSLYTIASLDAAALGKYDCVISGMCSPSVTSQTITIATATPTEITKQPQANVLVNEGASFTLSIAATGSDLTYQWLKNGSAIPGATAMSFNVAAASKSDEGQYTCEVSGGCGKVVSSPSSVVVQGGTSVAEESPDGSFINVTGPQPAGDVLNVFVSLQEPVEAAIRIIDMRSNVVGTMNIGLLTAGQHTQTVSVATLAAGCYVLEFNLGAVTLRELIAVQR